VFFVPVFFVIVEWIEERWKGRKPTITDKSRQLELPLEVALPNGAIASTR
jgi:hypothetical protein